MGGATSSVGQVFTIPTQNSIKLYIAIYILLRKLY